MTDRMYELIHSISREDRFRATVYAINTLLLDKGVYSPEEFARHFIEHAEKFGSRDETKPTL